MVLATPVAFRETYRLIATRADGIRIPLCNCLCVDRASEHRDMLLRVGAFSNVEIERRSAFPRLHVSINTLADGSG
jgi:hypothetical protein